MTQNGQIRCQFDGYGGLIRVRVLLLHRQRDVGVWVGEVCGIQCRDQCVVGVKGVWFRKVM